MKRVLLKKVETDADIKRFGTYKVELIKYHQQFAKKLSLQDRMVDEYSFEDAIRHIGKSHYYQFLIVDNNKTIGMLEYQITQSDIDGKDIIYLKNIYIEKDSRGKGFAKTIINDLKKFGYRIELECWYGMPSNLLYKSLGAKEIKTRYVLM